MFNDVESDVKSVSVKIRIGSSKEGNKALIKSVIYGSFESTKHSAS